MIMMIMMMKREWGKNKTKSEVVFKIHRNHDDDDDDDSKKEILPKAQRTQGTLTHSPPLQ